jgi:hypothetical protein
MKTFSQNLPEYQFNDDVRPADPAVTALAEATVLMISANASLEAARKRVPDYTGDSSVESYYAFEQDAFNRAAEAYADAVVAVVKVSTGGEPR